MIKKGDLLISTPDSLGDFYFNRTIITLTEVTDEEVVGFIINKPLNYNLSDVEDSVLNKKILIYGGGPVNQDNLYFIHDKPNLINQGINYYNELYWGGDFKNVVKLINENQIDMSSIKFFSGYSGWTYDQLIDEINNGSWILLKNKKNHIFNKNPERLWGDNMKKMGEKFKIWSNAPENPQNN